MAASARPAARIARESRPTTAEPGSLATPRTSPRLFNFTIIGNLAATQDDGAIQLRRGNGAKIANFLVVGYPVGLDLVDNLTCDGFDAGAARDSLDDVRRRPGAGSDGRHRPDGHRLPGRWRWREPRSLVRRQRGLEQPHARRRGRRADGRVQHEPPGLEHESRGRWRASRRRRGSAPERVDLRHERQLPGRGWAHATGGNGRRSTRAGHGHGRARRRRNTQFGTGIMASPRGRLRRPRGLPHPSALTLGAPRLRSVVTQLE